MDCNTKRDGVNTKYDNFSSLLNYNNELKGQTDHTNRSFYVCQFRPTVTIWAQDAVRIFSFIDFFIPYQYLSIGGLRLLNETTSCM